MFSCALGTLAGTVGEDPVGLLEVGSETAPAPDVLVPCAEGEVPCRASSQGESRTDDKHRKAARPCHDPQLPSLQIGAFRDVFRLSRSVSEGESLR